MKRRVKIWCGEEQHEILLSKQGAVVFLGHPRVPHQALALEGELLGPTSGCFYVAHCLLTQTKGPGYYPSALADRLTQAAARALERKIARKTKVTPPFGRPWMQRLMWEDHPLRQRALRHLRAVFADAMRVPTFVVVNPSTQNSYATWSRVGTKKTRVHRQLSVHLNLKKWARVALRGIEVVEERYFVTRVTKQWSENDLEVHVLQQSTGYSVREKIARIRRADDGKWRIHAWP